MQQFIIWNHNSRNRSRSLLQASCLNVANVACLIAAEAHRGMLRRGKPQKGLDGCAEVGCISQGEGYLTGVGDNYTA